MQLGIQILKSVLSAAASYGIGKAIDYIFKK